MIVSELIEKLLEYPQDLDVKIFDWRKNLNEDFGDGSSAGIYDFEVTKEELSDDEIKYLEEIHVREYIPFVQLTFESEDYSDEGVKYD